MPDITTTQIFSDGEKGITATKVNNIIGGATIQPDFVTTKPSSSTLDPTDQLLEVKGAGTYARITGQQLIDSVSASVTQNITPTIWSVRLRSFNAVGNPTFEVDQRISGGSNIASGVFAQDRWQFFKSGTLQLSALQGTAFVDLPGTSFRITNKIFSLTLLTQQTTLAASDYAAIIQTIEGPMMRELADDVHSISLLVRSSVTGLKFGVGLRDNSLSRSLIKLCTIPSANTFTLISLPNLPVWAPGGTYGVNPGTVGYSLGIYLAAGSTLTAPANDTWQNGNFMGALGQDNFASKAVNSTLDIAVVQHEPGAQCSTSIDCPFTKNLDDCLRYYQKTYDYGTAAGVGTYTGSRSLNVTASAPCVGNLPYYKPMAKVPTITAYSPATGAVGTVRDINAVIDRNVGAGYQPVGLAGFSGWNLATVNAAATIYSFHYTADTGL